MIAFTQEEFQELLNQFQEAFNQGEYTEKVPYDTWRRLKKLEYPRVECLGGTAAIRISNAAVDKNGIDINYFAIYCDNYSSNGFARFFADNFLKKEQKMNNNLTATNIAAATTTTVNNNYSLYSTSTTPINKVYSRYATASYLNTSQLAGICKEETKKENEKMKGFNFDFGPCGDTVCMSMYGLAVKNQAGEWVSYDPNSGEIVNVDVFNIAESGKWFYKMPIGIDDVKIGDLLIHAKKPCYVVGFNENTLNPIVIDIFNMEQKEILLQKSPFGFNFATRIISPFDNVNMKPADAGNPFGNMWMFAFMSNSEDFNIRDMVMLSMMSNDNAVNNMNPMMLMLMMENKDNETNWLMPFLMMSGNFITKDKCN